MSALEGGTLRLRNRGQSASCLLLLGRVPRYPVCQQEELQGVAPSRPKAWDIPTGAPSPPSCVPGSSHPSPSSINVHGS